MFIHPQLDKVSTAISYPFPAVAGLPIEQVLAPPGCMLNHQISWSNKQALSVLLTLFIQETWKVRQAAVSLKWRRVFEQ